MGEGESLGKRVWGSSDRPLRSVGGVTGSDTGVPEAPEAPSRAKGSPKLGQSCEAGCRERPFPPGMLGSGLARGAGGQGTPSQPGQDATVRFPAPPGKWGAPLPFPPRLPQRASSKPNSSARQQAKTAACAPLQPTPCSPDEGANGEMGGVVGVRITDPFIKGKSENPKKKIMIKRCANDNGLHIRGGGRQLEGSSVSNRRRRV